METRENILSRRSIRNYLPTPVSKEDLQEILEAGTWAPSAVNLQPWYFVAIQSKEELANLEIAYARVISLFAKLGSEQSSRVISFGNEYIKYFPEGKYLSDVNNYMNRAKADIPASSSTEEKTPEEGEGQE